jgi:hypothetical protein
VATALILGPEDHVVVRRLRWWRELAIIAVFYGLYSLVRDLNGSHPGSIATARANAMTLIRAERWLHIFAEQRIQAEFLHSRHLIGFLDDYYGTVHFVAVAVVLVVLFRWYPGRYALWRNTLAIATALALVGFLVFPVMPPRLLPRRSISSTPCRSSVGSGTSRARRPPPSPTSTRRCRPSTQPGRRGAPSPSCR